MSNLMLEAVIGLIVAVYVGYYGLVVVVESRTNQRPESSKITEDVQLGSLG